MWRGCKKLLWSSSNATLHTSYDGTSGFFAAFWNLIHDFLGTPIQAAPLPLSAISCLSHSPSKYDKITTLFFKAQPSNIWTKSSGLSTINKPQCQSALNNPESLLNPNKIFEKTCSTTIRSKIRVKEALKGLFDWVDILQGAFKSVETVDSCLCRSMSPFWQRLKIDIIDIFTIFSRMMTKPCIDNISNPVKSLGW